MNRQQSPEQEGRREKALTLSFPRTGNQVRPSELQFAWTPPEGAEQGGPVTYRLAVFELRPGLSFDQAVKGKPAYAVEGLQEPFHKYPKGAKGLSRERAYCWRVEARRKGEGLVAISEVQGFRFRPPWETRYDPVAVRPPPDLDEAHDLYDPAAVRPAWDFADWLPPPPIVWGCPVTLRPLSALPETPPESSEPGEPGGSVEPEAKTLWGSEAARLYLIMPFWQEARLWWNYSSVEGCDAVLLQIAGPEGFDAPNAEEARADEGVAAWYTGPVKVTDFTTVLKFEGGNPHRGSTLAGRVDLQYTGENHPVWEYLQLRVVPLDAEHKQIAPASDHVSVHCVCCPGISMDSCETEWTWGETPRRTVRFTFRLERFFPGFFPSTTRVNRDAPATFLIAARTPRTGAAALLRDDGLTEEDGTAMARAGTWYWMPDSTEGPAYFKLIRGWRCGETYTLTLEQSRPGIEYGGDLGRLVHFTDMQLRVYCIPGMEPHWSPFGQPLLDGNVPVIPCHFDPDAPSWRELSTEDRDVAAMGQELRTGYQESAFGQLYRLFTEPLSGRRTRRFRTVSGLYGDGEPEETVEYEENDVRIEFEYAEEMADADQLKSYMRRATTEAGEPATITMVETVDGHRQRYEFRMLGWNAYITPHDHPYRLMGYGDYPGRLVFDPPRLEMHFEHEYWVEDREVEITDTRDYYLSV